MLEASYTAYPLHFTRPAGTSRGILTEKPCWFVRLRRSDGTVGTGEVSFIPGLSLEDPEEIEIQLDHICKLISRGFMDPGQSLPALPGIQFALESAMLDLEGGGKHILFPSDFTRGSAGIQTNGLIWMGDPGHMKEQIEQKIQEGFRVLKLKVGALSMEEELEVISWVRNRFNEMDLEIRLDANGAWTPEEALLKMEQFAAFGIHSLEQPVAAGQWDALGRVCREAPVPVALDEELIGLDPEGDGASLLDTVRPRYLILKPGLLGGFRIAERWIRMAGEHGIGWWVTSALESSIGLNAVAQWTFAQELKLPQGLGTGMIYSNNMSSPMQLEGDILWYHPRKAWDLSQLNLR